MSDIRALLLKARNQAGHVMTITLQDAIDAALAEKVPEPVTLSRLREMFEDYRDAWSPGAKDELLATFYAHLSTAPPPASQSDARDAVRYRWLLEGCSHGFDPDDPMPQLCFLCALPEWRNALNEAIDAAIEREESNG